MMISSLEHALREAGMFGPSQHLMIVTAGIANIYLGWPSVVAVFVSIDVDFTCLQNGTSTLDSTHLDGGVTYDNECQDGCPRYIYKDTPSSSVSTFDLACGSGPTLASTSNSIFWVGFLISCLISGTLADTFGRRTVCLWSTVLYFLVSLLLPNCRNIYEFIAARFFCGLFHYPLTGILYILVAEWIEEKKIAKIGILIIVTFALGEALCSAMAYVFMYSWRLQLMIMAAPLVLIYLLTYFLIPESAKWLYQVGRLTDCEKVLKVVAKRNGNDPENIIILNEPLLINENHSDEETPCEEHDTVSNYDHNQNDVKDPLLPLVSENDEDVMTSESERAPRMIHLFATCRSSLLMLTHTASWFAVAIVYYGLAFGVSSIEGDIYVNSALIALVEIPAWTVSLAMDYIGRRKTLIICLFTSSLACLAVPITDSYLPQLSLPLSLAGKLLGTGGFDMLFVYTPEQLPTTLRSTGLSLCSASARVATIMAPFIVQAADASIYIPYLMFAVSGFGATVLCLFFAIETLNRPMPQSLAEYYKASENKSLPIRT